MNSNEDFSRKNSTSRVTISDDNKNFKLSSSKDRKVYVDIMNHLIKKKYIDSSNFSKDYSLLDTYCFEKKISNRLLKYINSLLFMIAFKLTDIKSSETLKRSINVVDIYLPDKKDYVIKYYRFFTSRNL